MTALVLVVVAALWLGLAGGWELARRRHAAATGDAVHHILMPFTGTEISRRAVDAALRLARAEGATLMPAYLAEVPKSLPLDCAIPAEANQAMAMLEAIEQRAGAEDVPVDARIERGRSYRHALARLLSAEDFDRVVVPAGATGTRGLSGEDLVWLLQRAPAEVMILRPGREDHRVVGPFTGATNGNRQNGGPTMTLDVQAKRVYEPAAEGDGYRVLVDHVWPRGVSRERARLDEWARELAPSDELRRWFDHVPERFEEFRRRYRDELKAEAEKLEELRGRARAGRVTIVYAARDEEHNNAVVVAASLRDG